MACQGPAGTGTSRPRARCPARARAGLGIYRGLRMRSIVPALLLLLALPAPLHAQDKTSAAKDLHALFDAEWERGLRENPVGATYLGDHRFDDRLPDLAPSALQAS